MKNVVMILLVGATLVGCGTKSGEGVRSNITGQPSAPLDPSCKAITSVWTSTTDLERHDFTGMGPSVVIAEYEFKGFDGATCGFASNPNHALTAQMQSPAEYNTTVRWDYRVNLNYSLALGGSCATYGTSDADPTQQMYIKISCGEIQICRGHDINGLYNCKAFR